MGAVTGRRTWGFDWLPFALFALALLVAYAVTRSGGATLVEDSPSYLEFFPIRTGGYPGFLALCEGLGMSLPQICLLQAVLYALATFWLSVEVFRFTGSRYMGLAITLMLWILPPLTAFHAQISTESLFLSLQVTLLALLLRVIRRRDAASFFGLCATASIAAAVRPVGFAFLPLAPILLVWCYRTGGLKRLGILAVAGMLVIAGVAAAEKAYYSAVHGAHRASLTGLHLFAKAALSRPQGPFDQAALSRLAPWQRSLFDRLGAESDAMRDVAWSAANPNVREHMINAYEAHYQYGFHDPVTRRMYRESACADPWCSDILEKLATIRLREAPKDYLRLTAIHYFGLWSVYGVRTVSGAEALKAFNDAHQPLPLASAIEKFNRRDPPLWYAAPVNVGVLAMGVLSAVTFAWLLFRLALSRSVHPYLAVAGLCAMLVHGNFLGVAMTGVSITRYTMAMWPTLLMSMGFLGLYLISGAVGRARPDSSAKRRRSAADAGSPDSA